VRARRRILPVLLLAAVSCSRLPPPGRGAGEVGIASWYGQDFHGRPTSSREIYDMHDMTAAHRTLPFGTHVMVTNLDNDRSTVVRINDRGPFVKGRIIDLSYAAARVLGMIGPGTARVRLEVLGGLRAQDGPPLRDHWVQAGAFTVQENAYALMKRLEKVFPGVHVSVLRTSSATYYRVRIKVPDRKSAERTAGRLAEMGLAAVILKD
jgi:rare lipoprotein A